MLEFVPELDSPLGSGGLDGRGGCPLTLWLRCGEAEAPGKGGVPEADIPRRKFSLLLPPLIPG